VNREIKQNARQFVTGSYHNSFSPCWRFSEWRPIHVRSFPSTTLTRPPAYHAPNSIIHTFTPSLPSHSSTLVNRVKQYFIAVCCRSVVRVSLQTWCLSSSGHIAFIERLFFERKSARWGQTNKKISVLII